MASSTTCPALHPRRPWHPRRTGVLLSTLLLLLIPVLLAVAPAPPAWSQAVGAQQPTVSSTAAPANTPQPTGQPLPSKRQRVADSLVAVFLLVVLVGGVAVAWFRARRARAGEAV